MTDLEKKLAGAIVELIDEVVKKHPRLEPALRKVQGMLRDESERQEVERAEAGLDLPAV